MTLDLLLQTLPQALPELLPVLVLALTLLLVVRSAARRPDEEPVRPSRGANAELRELIARGATVTTISRNARVPHDVATLAVHLELQRNGGRTHRARPVATGMQRSIFRA